MRIIFLSALVAAVLAGFPLSDNQCQCLAACGGPMFRLRSECSVSDSCQKSGNEDTCQGGSIADKAAALFGSAVEWLETLTGIDLETSMNKIRDWSIENVQAIDFDEIVNAGGDALAATAAAWDKLSDGQLQKLKGMAQDKFNEVVQEIPFDQLGALAADTYKQLEAGQIQAIKDKLASIKLEDVASWTEAQWQRIPVDNLAEMGWGALQQVPITELGQWTQEQWNKMPVDKLIRMTGEQLGNIDAAKVSAMGDQFWDAMPVYKVTKFGIELLQSADFLAHANATHIASITAAQWNSFPIDKIGQFTIEQMQGIDYEALGTWTKEMWDKVPLDKLAELTGKQISQINATVVGQWTKEQWLKFPASDAVMFTAEQLKEGAAVLKDLTDEQLQSFDWEQVQGDVLAALPQELQDRLQTIMDSDQMKTAKKTLKELFDQLSAANKDALAKEKAYQEKLDDPNATPAQVQEAQVVYEEALVQQAQLEAQVVVESNTVDGILASSSSRAAPALFVAVLVAVASFEFSF